MPELAKLSAPGCALARAISSFTLRAGSEGCATISTGTLAMFVTQARSLIGS